MTINQREFRDALSAFATGVTIITARDSSGEPVGMTASSFNSVSVDPPLVLWSVTKTALSADAFKEADHFAVHVLAYDQTDISNRFATKGADKFGETPHRFDDNDVPILDNVASRFDCKQWAVYEGGDHWVIIGEVLGFERARKDGLVFAGGAYATANPILKPRSDATADSPEIKGPVDDLLFYHLSRAYHQLSANFHDAVSENGLTLSEWRILVSIAGDGVVRTLTDLSHRTFIEVHILRDMLATLEDNGLCIIDTSDAQTKVRGTKKGDAKIEQLIKLSNQSEKEVFGDLGTTEADQLFALLKKVIDKTG